MSFGTEYLNLSGEWVRHPMRFASKREEVEHSIALFRMNYVTVRGVRTYESDETPNALWDPMPPRYVVQRYVGGLRSPKNVLQYPT